MMQWLWMRIKSQNRSWFIVSIFICIIFSGCSNNYEKESIKIGALLALSGEHASFGITEQRGMEIALEEINESGGINGKDLKIVYGDSRLEIERARVEYRRLVSKEKVPAILGVTGSGVALALAETAEKDQVVLLSDIDTSPALTKEGGNFFFRVIPSDDYSSKVLSEWTIERGFKKAALVYNSQNDWSMGSKGAIEDAYPKSGGKLLTSIGVVDDTTDFKPVLTTMKKDSPDAYFVCLMGRQAGLFVRQALDKGINGPFFGTDPFSQAEFVTNAKDALVNSFFVLPTEEESPALESFQSKFRVKYNQESDSIATNAYDTVKLLAYILRKLDKDGVAITGDILRSELQKVEYLGLIGTIAFDENHDIIGARFNKFTYKDGVRIPAQD